MPRSEKGKMDLHHVSCIKYDNVNVLVKEEAKRWEMSYEELLNIEYANEVNLDLSCTHVVRSRPMHFMGVGFWSNRGST